MFNVEINLPENKGVVRFNDDDLESVLEILNVFGVSITAKPEEKEES